MREEIGGGDWGQDEGVRESERDRRWVGAKRSNWAVGSAAYP